MKNNEKWDENVGNQLFFTCLVLKFNIYGVILHQKHLKNDEKLSNKNLPPAKLPTLHC